MIDLGTITGLRRHQHQLAAYCPRCDRWSVLPLDDLIAQGQGERRLPFTVRCRGCGGVGRLQVRPPVPTRVGTVGWASPDAGPYRPSVAAAADQCCRDQFLEQRH